MTANRKVTAVMRRLPGFWAYILTRNSVWLMEKKRQGYTRVSSLDTSRGGIEYWYGLHISRWAENGVKFEPG